MRALLLLLGRLPLPVLHGAGALVGWLLWLIPNSRRRVALTNIARCFPDAPAARARLLARRGLVHEMKSLFEMPFFWLGSKPKLLASLRGSDGEDLIEESLARGRGLILLTLHLGGFEVPGHVYATKRPITGIYKEQGGAIEALSRQGRMRTGAKLVTATPAAMRAILEALTANEAVYFMPDQDPPLGRGVFAPFFGIPAHSPVLVSKLVQRTGAPVLFMYAERLDWGRGYVAHYRRAPAAIYDADLQASVAAMNAGLEACIRELPQQYWWGYRRFRRRPPGEPPFYA